MQTVLSPQNDPVQPSQLGTYQPERVIYPKRSLPGSRAILGGLLVAISIVGSFAISTGAASGASQRYVVANKDLAPGTRLQASDLRIVRFELSSPVADRTWRSKEKLVGTYLVGPVGEGELLQLSSVVSKLGEQNQPEISFGITASRALGGDLKVGEKVDVLSSGKSAGATTATAAVSDATVTKIQRGGSSIGSSSSELTITLAVDTISEATAVANAVDQSEVTLIRTTGVNR